MSFEKTRLGRDLIALGKKQGLELGEKRGLERGEKQGLIEAIARVIESRFGRRPPRTLLRALHAIEDLDRLRDLVGRAAGARDLEAFRRRVPRAR